MFKRKQKRTIDNIGKKIYEFDFILEKIIYEYLCFSHMKKKELKKLDEKLKFVTYKEWKKYILDKYKGYEEEKLIEFSRYLNQRIRNVEPAFMYLQVHIPVMATIIFTKAFDFIFETKLVFSGTPKIFVAAFVLLFDICVIMPLIFFVWHTFKPFRENCVEKNFLKDYKEIIDNLINSKK